MPEPIYVPVLKGKEGEYAAIEALDATTKSLILPLIEIPEIPYDYVSEAPAKTLGEHVSGVPSRLHRAMGQMPFYLDITWLSEESSNAVMPLEFVLAEVTTLGGKAIPVVYRESSPSQLQAAKAHSLRTGSGTCVRLLISDFEEDIDLEAETTRMMSTLGPDEDCVDLIIDLEDLGSNAGTASLIARSIFSMLPHRERWRRITLAAASFPEDLSDVNASTVVNLPRLEWDLWKVLQKRPSALPRRDLIYGDYAMAHPVGKSLDPRTMRMSANIRYTTESDWLVIKGRNVRQYGFNQYFEMCRLLVERPEYCGRYFSWGDGFISDCADATQGPGNATTWRKVGVNHHVTLVTRALASLQAAV